MYNAQLLLHFTVRKKTIDKVRYFYDFLHSPCKAAAATKKTEMIVIFNDYRKHTKTDGTASQPQKKTAKEGNQITCKVKFCNESFRCDC